MPGVWGGWHLPLLLCKLLTCDVGPVTTESCGNTIAPAASVQAAAPDVGVSSTESSTAGGVLISAVGGVMTLAASMSSGVCSCTDEHICVTAGNASKCGATCSHASMAEPLLHSDVNDR